MGESFFWTTNSSGESLVQPPWYRQGVACTVLTTSAPVGTSAIVPRELYRFYVGGVHFWTTDSEGESFDPGDPTLKNREGIACYILESPVNGSVPLYRFNSPATGLHFWTIDQNGEKLGRYPSDPTGYQFEAAIGYVFPPGAVGPGLTPLYRFTDIPPDPTDAQRLQAYETCMNNQGFDFGGFVDFLGDLIDPENIPATVAEMMIQGAINGDGCASLLSEAQRQQLALNQMLANEAQGIPPGHIIDISTV